MRDAKDRSASWMIAHHGDSLVRLAGLTGFTKWQAVASRLSHPQTLPDGLLDLTFPARSQPVPVLVEVESYPDRETEEQVLRDVASVLLERRTLPEVITIVLHPKGQYRLRGEQNVQSAQGSAELRLRWRVIEMWDVAAADLLNAGDVGLMPWLPLTRTESPPEVLLQLCRERIEQQAKPKERRNMLAVAQVMCLLRYNDPDLLDLLGGAKMISEIPYIQELIAEHGRETLHSVIVDLLQTRFGSIPEELGARIRSINDRTMLQQLVRLSASCPDLTAFQQQMPS